MQARTPSRPTYVLGAGFSKAVSEAMPLMDELGRVLQERLAGEIPFELLPEQSFEDWLTLQVTPLPFLEGFANARRSANAARVVAEIAKVLDVREAEAAAALTPLWLRQLLALWDAEQAAVLTFNYDTLIERAVNADQIATAENEHDVGVAVGDHVVYPAPPAPPAITWGDFGSPHTAASFQLLKLHGSLAWFWSETDAAGSTLVRVRERGAFGSTRIASNDHDFSGTTTLDRYLIPPVTSKDGYYGSYLANTLWRSARAIVADTVSITLIGYSLPSGDRVAGQLIAECDPACTISVVDLYPGQENPASGVVSRLRALGRPATSLYSGTECVRNFVAEKLQSAILALPDAAALQEADRGSADVAVAIAHEGSADVYLLAWNSGKGVFETHRVDLNEGQRSNMPFREIALNSLPSGMGRLEDFVTEERFNEYISGGQPFVFTHPTNSENVVAVGARRLKVASWELLLLKWAPLG